MKKKNEKAEPVRSSEDGKAKAENSSTSRREFIEKTLKLTAGAYAGMTIVDSFVGPMIGTGGMPVNAASGTDAKRGGHRGLRDGHPGEDRNRGDRNGGGHGRRGRGRRH